MAGLSNLFGGNDTDTDSSSTNSDNSSFLGDLNTTLGIDASNSNSSYSQDEDGEVNASQSEQDFGLDTSTDGLLHSITDTSDSSDSSVDQ